MYQKILIMFTATLMSASAMGGLSHSVPVEVDPENRVAQGDPLTARSAKNDVEMIGCGTRHFDVAGDAVEIGFCQAVDAAGVTGFCQTVHPALVAGLAGISDFSFVTFSWDENGDCTRIGFSTQSVYLPKKLVN